MMFFSENKYCKLRSHVVMTECKHSVSDNKMSKHWAYSYSKFGNKCPHFGWPWKCIIITESKLKMLNFGSGGYYQAELERSCLTINIKVFAKLTCNVSLKYTPWYNHHDWLGIKKTISFPHTHLKMKSYCASSWYQEYIWSSSRPGLYTKKIQLSIWP